MTGALSVHYAQALAETVFQPNSGLKPELAVEQLREAEALIAGSRDLQLALLTPAINKARKVAILKKISDDLGLNRLVRNFLSVLVSHRRITQLKAIRQSFEEVVDERLGWIRADITSAHALNADERQQIEAALGGSLGKFIRAHYQVDPSLLAGVRAQVASKEYDATLKGKLDSLRQRLHTTF